jgi:hypothetical protein
MKTKKPLQKTNMRQRGFPYLMPVIETLRQLKKYHDIVIGDLRWDKQIDEEHSKNEKKKQ